MNAPKPQYFKPGQSGNPKGRPKGARSRLGEDFIADLAEHWRANGVEALNGCLKESPAAYCRIVASLMPKEVKLERPLGDLSNADLERLVDQLRTEVYGTEGIGSGDGAEGSAESAPSVRTIQ